MVPRTIPDPQAQVLAIMFIIIKFIGLLIMSDIRKVFLDRRITGNYTTYIQQNYWQVLKRILEE